MPAFNRSRLLLNLFHDGLPEDLTSVIGLEAPPWLFLSTPIEMLAPKPGEDLPDTLDLIGGRLMPRPGADLSGCERSALFHFGRDGQEVQRRRLLTELALGRDLLEPDVFSLFAVQFCLPCERREAHHLARRLGELGFARVIILVGKDSTDASAPEDDYVVVRSHVEDEDGTLRLVVDGAPEGVVPLRERRASERLRSRLSRLITKMHLPKKLPIVIDMSAHDRDG